MAKYRVIIADDEIYTCKSICNLLKRQRPEIEIVGQCHSGEEVIKILSRTYVDFLITDIKMPGKTGIDVMKYIKDHKLNTMVIVMTGYREYEYAVKAIKYGAMGFIEKPIDFGLFLKSVDEIEKKIIENANKKINISKNVILHHKYVKNFLVAFLLNSNFTASSENMSLFNNVPIEKCRCALINFIVADDQENADKIKKYHGNMWADMCEISNDYFDVYCLCENQWEAKILVFINNKNTQDNSDSVINFAEDCKNIVKKAYSINSRYDVCYFDSIGGTNRNIIADRIISTVQKFSNDLLNQDENKVEEQFNKLYQQMDYENIKIWFGLLIKNLESNQGFVCDSIKLKMKAVTKKTDIIDLMKELKSNIKNRYKEEASIVERVKQYIGTAEFDFSINQVARVFSYNPAYLSRIFKISTGINFTDYAMEIRMERAKELLKHKENSIEHVANIVGYTDVDYFKKIFTKKFGYSPKEFKRLHLN